MKHTPTPWKQHQSDDKTYASVRGANNETIADCGSRSDAQAQANTAFIVRAGNSHEALVEALTLLLAGAEAMQKMGANQPQLNGGVILARAAIATLEK